MANEQLTIGQDKARLSVIGKSWPDMNFDSGIGLDLSQIIFDILIDLDIPMPDIDLDDLDDIPIIPGLDIDTDIPTLEYPDPDWPDDEIPPIIDWPMPDLDWDDFIDKWEDLDLDLNILKDLSFVGLNDLGIPTLVSLDEDFNIREDELPTSIEIVTMPNKLEYQDGERIDLTGMVVTAKKSDGTTWTSAKYPNGHIPLGELITEPLVATEEGRMAYNFDYGFFCHLTNKYYDRTFTKTSWGKAYGGLIISPNGWHNPVIVSDDEAAVRWHCEDVKSPIFTRDFGVSGSTVVHGLRVYYGTGYGLLKDSSGSEFSASGISTYYGSLEGLLESIIVGDGHGLVSIRWRRPGDGEELSTAFEIEVIPRGNGGGR
jgi:hypothetical protein